MYVTIRFAEVINTVPRMGAVYYNDCLYIAHNSTLLTHRYRHELGKLNEALLHSAGFVDFLPRFRSAGDQVMTNQLVPQPLLYTIFWHICNDSDYYSL